MLWLFEIYLIKYLIMSFYEILSIYFKSIVMRLRGKKKN